MYLFRSPFSSFSLAVLGGVYEELSLCISFFFVFFGASCVKVVTFLDHLESFSRNYALSEGEFILLTLFFQVTSNLT